MRSSRALTVWVLALLLILSLVPAAGAEEGASTDSPDLATGWSIAGTPANPILVYTLSAALPVRDARPEFRDGEVVLGYPVERGGRLELALTPAQLAALGSPSAWLSGKRLDGPTPAEAFTTEPVEATLARRALSGLDDPGTPGPYATTTLSYQLDDLAVDGYPAPLEVLAEVIAPVGATEPMPMVLFLHGRHSTCYSTDPAPTVSGDWPCPEGTLPIPSYQGYRYAAELLASQGYLTVSISANGINAQDAWIADAGASARSILIRHHLAAWVAWNNDGGDPWGGTFQGAVDLDNVVLVGHSRGGEGVERAAIDASPTDGYTIVGLVPIGPTSFGRQVGAGIATAVILPYCDGDVIDLQGQTYVDDSRDLARGNRALRSAVMVLGANHNYFNTEWTPGLAQAPAEDDWGWGGSADDPNCGWGQPGRLTAEQQQAAGATYISALVRLAVHRDGAAASLLDGSRVRAASAGAARVLTHALGGRRSLMYRPHLRDLLSTTGMSARVCRGYVSGGDWGEQSDCVAASQIRTPHWLPMMGAGGVPSPLALDLQWWRVGGIVRLALPRARDLSLATSLDFRLAVDASSPAVDLGLRLTDALGATAELPAAYRLAALPGDQSPLGKIWAQTLRFDLTGVGDQVDLRMITAIELVSRTGRGRAWLLDIHTRRPGATASSPIALPQVSVLSSEVAEGGPGTRTEYLPLAIRGDITRRAVLWVTVVDPAGNSQGYRLVLPAGTTEAGIPIEVTGNDQFDPQTQQFNVVIKAMSEVTTGEYSGVLTVVDDEPAPTLTFEATIDRVAEGGTLVFTATLSEPIAIDLWYNLSFGEVAGKPALYTDDVPEAFLMQWMGWIPVPAQPLWQSIWANLQIPAGATTGTFEIPTVADGILEGREYITVTMEGWEDPLLPLPITVTGIVRDS
jgi:hypothetical protein